MFRIIVPVLLMLLLSLPTQANDPPTGEEILKQMDAMSDYDPFRYTGDMTIFVRGKTRTKTLKAISLPREEMALVEFTNKSDDGTRFLLRDEQLWIYFPDEDDVVRISGHLLKEGMMGSDMSYEDALSSKQLREKYSIAVLGDTVVSERSCWKIELVAKVRDVPYYRRVTSVDKERFIPMEEEMYARSGRLLKRMSVERVERVGDFYMPVEVRISDQLRQDTYTVFRMSDIRFDESVKPEMFNMRNLRDSWE